MYIHTIWLYWCDVLDSDSFSVFQLNATRAIRGRFLAVVLILVCTYYQNCIHFELRPMFFLWLHLHKINISNAILLRKLKGYSPLIFLPKNVFATNDSHIWNQRIQLEEPFFEMLSNNVYSCLIRLQCLIDDILKIFFNFLNENISFFAKQLVSQKKNFLFGKSHTFYKLNVWQNKSVVNSVGHNLLVVWHWCLHHFGCPSYLLLQPFYSLFCSFEFKRSNELYVFIFCQKILKRCERIRWIY